MTWFDYDKEQLEKARKAVKIPWTRFCNGIKLDGKEKQTIMTFVYSHAPYIRALEQRIYNLERVLKTPHLLAAYLKTDCKHYYPDGCQCKCHSNNAIIIHDHPCCSQCDKCGFREICACDACKSITNEI